MLFSAALVVIAVLLGLSAVKAVGPFVSSVPEKVGTMLSGGR
jgi:hypothetical protein